MSEHDELIGRNLARLRQGMSQTELANEMRARGHKWTQPTVVAIEKGERPLRLSEAWDATAILPDAEISDFVSYPASLDFYRMFVGTRDQEQALLAAAHAYEAGTLEMLRLAEQYEVETGRSADDLDGLQELIIAGIRPSGLLYSARAVLAHAAREAREQASRLGVTWPSDRELLHAKPAIAKLLDLADDDWSAGDGEPQAEE